MNIWRMKLRAGSGGFDMWPQCEERKIAAMTHPPILNTNLTKMNRQDVDPAVKTSAMASIRRFAWGVEGGDVIYVGDSKTKSLIARGYVDGEVGTRAYRYNAKNPIYPGQKDYEPWRHEVPVIWDRDFQAVEYRDGAPLVTLSPIEKAWQELSERLLSDAEQARPPLNDGDYQRETEASKKNILRLHASLSNRFRLWLEKSWKVTVVQEKKYVDSTFRLFGKTTMVEFKICYGSQTRRAIREALGQILEYNHYAHRTEMQSWWLVLDHPPSTEDHRYVATLRERYGFPIVLGWPARNGFELSPTLIPKAR